MLQDIPYSKLQKNERSYKMMLLRDQHRATFAQIAEKYGVSLVRAQQIYRQTKIMQIHLYLNHLAVTLKQSDCLQMQKVYDKAYKSYQDWVCVCAYLEKRYRRILESYRAGEPGMPAAFLKALPPLRPHLTSKEVKRIVKLREEEKMSYRAIGEELRITPAKAKYTYDWFYHQQVLVLLKERQKDAADKQKERALWNYYFTAYRTPKQRYDALVNDS